MKISPRILNLVFNTCDATSVVVISFKFVALACTGSISFGYLAIACLIYMLARLAYITFGNLWAEYLEYKVNGAPMFNFPAPGVQS